MDEALVPHARRLRIGRSNFRLLSDISSKESTLQLVYDVLRLNPFLKAFLVTVDVPKIYTQEFWATTTIHHHSIRFKMDNKKHIVNLESFREMLHICPRLPGQSFVEPPFEEEILAFLRFLGHNGEIRRLNDVNINKLHQPWRSFASIINKCLTGKSSGYDSLRLSQAQILWGLYHKRNVDFTYLMWEDFIYQVKHKDTKKSNEMYYPRFIKVKHKDTKKSNEMYYPRFIKVIIHHFMSKDPSIPRRNKVNWHYVRDDHMFTTIKLVSKHQNTQQFSPMLPIELTNADIRNSDAYKEYYATATGATPPKPKASVRKTRSSFDTTVTPSTAAAGPRLSTSAKGKQPATTSKSKSLPALSEVAMIEAQLLKLASKKSLQQTHISQANGSGADEGTSTIPGVPDVPTDESEEEISWKSTDEEEDDDDQEDEGNDNDDQKEGSDDEQAFDEEEFIHPNLSTHAEEETRDEEILIPSRKHLKTQMMKAMALVEAYESDKIILDTYEDTVTLKRRRDDDADKDEEPSAGSDRGPRDVKKERSQSQQALQRRKLPGVLASHHVIPFDHFINNDLEYLRGGASSCKYTTSVTKTNATDYGHIKWIKDLAPRTMWIQEPESTRNVYSKRRIVAVTELKIVEWHNYKHFDWIMVRRDNDKLYKFKEGNFKRLRIQDIEDMRVEDLQLDVESYQKKLNLTKPDTDETLTDVHTALDDRLKGIRMKYLPQLIWRKSDKDRAATMIQAIDKILKTRRIMRSLERFVGGRLYEGDFRMLQRTICFIMRSLERTMDTTIDQQVEIDEALVPHAKRLSIGRRNFLLLSDISSKESTLQLVYDVLCLSPFFKAFLVTADVLKIYMQEFWVTATVHHHSIRFKMDNKKHIVNLESFRDMLHICPRLTHQPFVEPPFKEEILAFLWFLRHNGAIRRLTDVNINKMHQPWRSFSAIINKCLTGKSSGYDSLRHGTLTDVRIALDDRLKGIWMKYLPKSIWRKSDKDRVAALIQAIDKILKTRRIMRSLERFVG
nr:hypothetical protein [Tanacetum cinerariifolium]